VTVFEDPEPDGVHGVGRRGGGEAVKSCVGVTIWLGFESDGVTLGSAGHDVATLVRHLRHDKSFLR
jgi:hypothetical protein